MTAQEAIRKLLDGASLSFTEAQQVMRRIMEGEVTPAQLGALLALLRQRGESVQEIAGFASAMRDKAVRVVPPAGCVLDTCGTGGDGSGSFNVSTLAAIVAAAAGIIVAEHGNRSVSSRVGSADLLEALGVRLDLSPEHVATCMHRTGFGFLFAPHYHAAMKHAAAPRRELGVRTVFNILGPLTNPAAATHQLLGVYDVALTRTLAEVLDVLGTQRALVVHGHDGLDEVSPTGPSRVVELRHGRIAGQTIDPEELGLARRKLDEIRGGDLAVNAAIARRVLDGEPGAYQDAVVLNAACALYVADKVDDLWSGVGEARALLAGGQARDKLAAIVACTQELGA